MDALTRDLSALPTPCYVVDETLLERNLQILKEVADRAGCRILLAQKAFSMFAVYPLIGRYLAGTAASGLYEAKLGHTEMGGETHVFSAAYREDEFDEILSTCDHVVFNSFAQWERYKGRALAAGRSCGIRLNPECSTQEHGIYDPCAPYSRLGVTLENFRPELLDGIEGLHFHTLCEQNSDALTRTVAAVEERFGEYLPRMKWVNFGGGHHVTKPGYDIDALVDCVVRFREKYGVTVYLEPGEAVALNAGFLVTRVLDVVDNGMQIAVLDASAACHMPDVLEMPYRPPLRGAAKPGEQPYTYRLAGPTCLAGDVIGDYAFDHALRLGSADLRGYGHLYHGQEQHLQRHVASGHPASEAGGGIRTVRAFGYEDFKSRLS
jgi:carboxynorspermidine decarboxylase